MKKSDKEKLTKALIDKALHGNSEESFIASRIIFNSIDQSYKFRPVRESYDEAIAEMERFVSPIQLLDYIDYKYEIDISSVRTEYQCMDNRALWEDESYIILAKWKSGTEYPVGYTNYPITERNVTKYLNYKKYLGDLNAGKVAVRQYMEE